MAAKKPPLDTPPGSTSESLIQDIEPEKDSLLEAMVVHLIEKLPDHSEDEIREVARTTMLYVAQKVMEGTDVISGNMLFRRKEYPVLKHRAIFGSPFGALFPEYSSPGGAIDNRAVRAENSRSSDAK